MFIQMLGERCQDMALARNSPLEAQVNLSCSSLAVRRLVRWSVRVVVVAAASAATVVVADSSRQTSRGLEREAGEPVRQLVGRSVGRPVGRSP